MLYNPFFHAFAVRERIDRYQRDAAFARLFSAPRSARPGAEADRRPSAPAVTAAVGAGPPR